MVGQKYIWSTMSTKYCKLGMENKMRHAHSQCLHVKMKVLLVDFSKINPIVMDSSMHLEYDIGW
jgi:hypothetical protein